MHIDNPDMILYDIVILTDAGQFVSVGWNPVKTLGEARKIIEEEQFNDQFFWGDSYKCHYGISKIYCGDRVGLVEVY